MTQNLSLILRLEKDKDNAKRLPGAVCIAAVVQEQVLRPVLSNAPSIAYTKLTPSGCSLIVNRTFHKKCTAVLKGIGSS